MVKYQAIFSGETHPTEQLGQRCAFVISLSFHRPESLQTNDLNKFIATIERLRVAFADIDIIISDTLNRHNAVIYYPESDPQKKALDLGDGWLRSLYSKEANKLNGKSFLRWSELIDEEKYNDLLKITESIYINNPLFSSIVDFVCAKFVMFICDKRNKTIENNQTTFDSKTGIDYSNFDLKKTYDNCHNYILEECAVTLMLRLKNYNHLFHIGKVNKAVDWIAKNSIDFMRNCNRLFIDAINNNPLKVTIALNYKPCSVSTISNKIKIRDNSENALLRNVAHFFKNLQSTPSKSTNDIFIQVNQRTEQRRKSSHN